MGTILGQSVTQRQAALVEANRVRFYRAGVKRELRGAPDRSTALRWAGDHIADPSADVVGMRVAELLCGCRYVGPECCRRLLARAEVRRSSVTVGGLTLRERLALLEVIGGRP